MMHFEKCQVLYRCKLHTSNTNVNDKCMVMVVVSDLKILPVSHTIQESVLTASRKSWGLFSPIRIGSAEQPRGAGTRLTAFGFCCADCH